MKTEGLQTFTKGDVCGSADLYLDKSVHFNDYSVEQDEEMDGRGFGWRTDRSSGVSDMSDGR